MLYRRLLLFLGANLLFCCSIAVLKEWRHLYHRTGETRQIRQRRSVLGPTVQYSKLPLQDESLSREKRISASKAHFDPVDDVTEQVVSSDQAHLELPRAVSKPQTPRPSGTPPPHAYAATGGAGAGVALILFCYDRAEYLHTTLQSLAGLLGLGNVTLIVSQDGTDSAVAKLVQGYAEQLQPPAVRAFEHWCHPRIAMLGASQPGHAWLSQHYKWALDRVFLERGHSHVIIVEDDMVFSPDFLTFFQAAAPLLEQDPTIWCLSSWNDNGQSALDWDPQKLFRTSYFPGLGWLMRRELWLELGPDFPLQAWDHWMRLNTTSKGRDCVAPEVNRNRNIGEKGVNMRANYFHLYLRTMNWAEQAPQGYSDLSQLAQPAYETSMAQLLAAAGPWPGGTLDSAELAPGQVYLLPYLVEEYAVLVKPIKLWPNPRGHYRGLTRISLRGAVVLLADRRVCPYLPPGLRVLPADSLRAVPAQRAEDCDLTCRVQGMACSSDDFWFVNKCEVLMRHFGCERGCAVEMGADIPTYVLDPAYRTYQTCLVGQTQPLCDARHNATARLCPCVTAAH